MKDIFPLHATASPKEGSCLRGKLSVMGGNGDLYRAPGTDSLSVRKGGEIIKRGRYH